MINSWLFQVFCRVHQSLHESPLIYIQTMWPPLGIWQLKDEWIVLIAVSSTPAFPSCQNRNITDMSDFDGFNKEISFYCFIVCCCRDVLDIRWPGLWSTLHKTVWWKVSCCSSIHVPAALSLIPCAGGVGTGLSATPSACPTLCAIWQLPWLLLKALINCKASVSWIYFFTLTCDVVESQFTISFEFVFFIRNNVWELHKCLFIKWDKNKCIMHIALRKEEYFYESERVHLY